MDQNKSNRIGIIRRYRRYPRIGCSVLNGSIFSSGSVNGCHIITSQGRCTNKFDGRVFHRTDESLQRALTFVPTHYSESTDNHLLLHIRIISEFNTEKYATSEHLLALVWILRRYSWSIASTIVNPLREVSKILLSGAQKTQSIQHIAVSIWI